MGTAVEVIVLKLLLHEHFQSLFSNVVSLNNSDGADSGINKPLREILFCDKSLGPLVDMSLEFVEFLASPGHHAGLDTFLMLPARHYTADILKVLLRSLRLPCRISVPTAFGAQGLLKGSYLMLIRACFFTLIPHDTLE